MKILLIDVIGMSAWGSRRAKSYCVKLRRPYGIRRGAPGKEEIDPERLSELWEYYRVSDHIPSYLWRLITQRYYNSEKVSNNQIIKLITFWKKTRTYFQEKRKANLTVVHKLRILAT